VLLEDCRLKACPPATRNPPLTTHHAQETTEHFALTAVSCLLTNRGGSSQNCFADPEGQLARGWRPEREPVAATPRRWRTTVAAASSPPIDASLRLGRGGTSGAGLLAPKGRLQVFSASTSFPAPRAKNETTENSENRENADSKLNPLW
jgi:hypothetical protein